MFQKHNFNPSTATPLGLFEERTAALVIYRQLLTSTVRSGQIFSVRLAYDDHEHKVASGIINRLYGERGYGYHHDVLARPECMTFTACIDEDIIGTLTLRVDSPHLLSADKTFPAEISNLRVNPHVTLCELTKFAFEPSRESRPLLAKLFHVIFIYGRQRFACSDLVIEVNPRHVSFYETMLGFASIGHSQTNEVVDAPSQLMHLAVPEIGKNIIRYAGTSSCSSRSLYHYFLTEPEVKDVRLCIAASTPQRPSVGLANCDSIYSG